MASASLAYLIGLNCERVWMRCQVAGCRHDSYVDVAGLVLRFGEGTTLEQIERASVCGKCGVKGKVYAEPVVTYADGWGGFTPARKQ